MSDAGTREARYATLLAQADALFAELDDRVARMATAAALLKDGLPDAFWVGFYLPAPDGSLVVGPYQGPLACLRLPPGRGVCGAAAARGETILVPDVHAFPGHIACDPRSRSEIVVPVLAEASRGAAGENRPAPNVVAVLDVDAERPDAFDEVDCVFLEELARRLFRGAAPA